MAGCLVLQDIEQHKPCRPRRALPRLASNGKQVLTDYSLTVSPHSQQQSCHQIVSRMETRGSL
jgi:hypothetical protein